MSTSRSPLPRWGEKAKVLTKLGAVVWGAFAAIGWVIRLVVAAAGGEVPTPIAWAVGAPAAAGFTIVLVAGVVWLVAELATGLREPPQPD